MYVKPWTYYFRGGETHSGPKRLACGEMEEAVAAEPLHVLPMFSDLSNYF